MEGKGILSGCKRKGKREGVSQGEEGGGKEGKCLLEGEKGEDKVVWEGEGREKENK